MNIIDWYNSTDDEREQFLEDDDNKGDLTRYRGNSRERYGVQDVPLTMYERGVIYQALKNEITYWEQEMQDGNVHVPERISILRNALQSVAQFDGTKSWGEPLCEKCSESEFEWVGDNQ